MSSNRFKTSNERGEMIAVLSAKGGVGRTFLAVNLAAALIKKNISIGVLDGNFQFGDIGLAMDLQSTFTIKEVIDDLDRLDEFTLASYLCTHDSGVKVLPAPERPEYADLVTPEALNKIIDLMRIQHDYVICDTGSNLDERTIHLIEKADEILVVTNLEMATLKNTKLLLETLAVLGLQDKVQVIVNRATMESVIEATDVPDILGAEEPVYIPNDFQAASQSLNIGIPLVMNQGKTVLAKSIFKLAEQLTSKRDIQTKKTSKRSIFSKIFNRKGGKEESAE